ncbi:MAG: SMP-30/gluconolactonase/LRE family protein [Gammaproteobacteria bacterium]
MIRRLGILLGLITAAAPVAANVPLPTSAPRLVLDLSRSEDAAAVDGRWRYSDVRIVESRFLLAGIDGQPSTQAAPTYDIAPQAGAADFDDAHWETITPESLPVRRTHGRLAFAWYRLQLTVPERIGAYRTAGSTLVLETSVDDYAEIWVDGELARTPMQTGGSIIGGWNAVNRLVVGQNVRPGQRIRVALFGANGPLSDPPTNYVYVRTARLEFHDGAAAPVAIAPSEVNVEVERLDPALDAIVPRNPKVYKLASGFQFTEGPLWRPEGYLLFSDPNANRIYKYDPSAGLSVYKEASGYSGADIAEYGQPGSNGLTLDPQGRLTIDQHGNHRVVRVEPDGTETVLADSYQGRRLNSPNDLVYRRTDGALYFTDPPFGLPKFHDDPRKELPFSGIYRWHEGRLTLLDMDLAGPNGIAFSPAEDYLYVANWDTARKVVMRYPVRADGTLGAGTVFFDMTSAPGEEALDGLKVDTTGNLYVSGPGGVWILSPEGRHLGTIRLPQLPANFAWGDEDGRTLYMTARSGLYRMRLNVAGVRP